MRNGTPKGDPAPGKSLLADTHPDMARVHLATMVTFSLFFIFAAPTISMITLGMDADVVYWVGWAGLFAYGLPLLLILQHIVHTRMHEPKRIIIVLGVLFPAVFFAAIGGVYTHELNLAATRLYDADCNTFGEKSELQAEYESAQKIYDTCNARLAKSGMPPEATVETCNEYQDVESRADDRDLNRWRYLARVEPIHMCAGFCTGGKSLWSHNPAFSPPCARFLALKLYSSAQQASLTLWYSVAVIVLYFPAHMLMAPFFRAFGYSHSS